MDMIALLKDLLNTSHKPKYAINIIQVPVQCDDKSLTISAGDANQDNNAAATGKASVDEIAVYSFALKPEEHQPSGTCNFSRIDNAQLKNSELRMLINYTP